MLDKQRDTIIKQAFRKAKITSPETDPTDVEMEDAVFSLNAMLASWNNDGFRLFKMKTGYMPLLPRVSDYKLSTQAYKSFEKAKIASFNTIGATKIQVISTAGIAVGQSLVVTNNTSSETNFVEAIDGDVITLRHPLDIACVAGDTVTCGEIVTQLVADAPLAVREVVTATPLLSAPAAIAVKSSGELGQIIPVERQVDSFTVILEESISPLVLESYGEIYLPASKNYDQIDVVKESDHEGDILYYAVGGDGEYMVTRSTEDPNATIMYYRAVGSNEWTTVSLATAGVGSGYKIQACGDTVYILDPSLGLLELNAGVPLLVFSSFGVEEVIFFEDEWFLFSVSDDDTAVRQVTSTSDFVEFNNLPPVIAPSLANPVAFAGKLFVGTTTTLVTSDMHTFNAIPIYSENRCVVGDKLMNINSTQLCSYTEDGTNWHQIPFRLSQESSWASYKGCSFISIVDETNQLQPDCSQIFLTNSFEPDWNNQMVVQGKVSSIQFYDGKAYFVSPTEVKAMVLVEDYDSMEFETDLFVYGEAIGRPQEIMNVVKYSLYGFVELPMDPVALKDYTRLPQISADGEPVSYCFFRDSQYGKMLVWGTPRKLGEYLKFTYVEPMTLLEDSSATPDFPDEYVEAVIDGLAVQLGHEYGVPENKMQLLMATAEESKSLAELHDNEDTSYQIAPNHRGL